MIKVALIGPESTGKSELTVRLAEYFLAPYEAEYAREYISKLEREYNFSDVSAIARNQIERELFYQNEYKGSAPYVFFDTELIITKVWFEYCYGSVPEFVQKRLDEKFFDLYLLCVPDLPWEPDPVREHGHDREFFFDWYRREIEQLGKPYVVINGTGKERFENAVNAIKDYTNNIVDNMKDKMPEIIEQLSDIKNFRNICHEDGNNLPMPSVEVLAEIVQITRSLLFPGYFGDAAVNVRTISRHIADNIEKLQRLLTGQIKSGACFDDREEACPEELEKDAENKAMAFISRLPEIRNSLYTDVIAAYNGDPAAKSYGEIIFCYPAIRAISNYRIAHALLRLGIPLIPRIITEMAHSETGIDIHPGAVIGNYFTIDHGTGVVIGETSVIGENVKIYQGVTLGAKSFPLDEQGNPIKGIDRHPKIGNNVIIYANSTILGTIHVGDGAIIGGNIWVDTDVPPGAKLVQRKCDK